MTCDSSAPIVFAPVPTTDIFASVAAERSGLKSQKTQVSSVGTLMKNLRDCGCECGREYYERVNEREEGGGRRERKGGTYEELGVVVLEDVCRLLRRGLLVRVALRHANALVVCRARLR